MTRRVIGLMTLTIVVAACGGGEQAATPVPAQTLDFAVDAHMLAADTASAARVALQRTAPEHELALRSADLQADSADLEARIREEHPGDARAHAPLLAAADALLEGTRRLAGTVRAPTATSAGDLSTELDAVQRRLDEVADTIDGELAASRTADIDAIRRPLPVVPPTPVS